MDLLKTESQNEAAEPEVITTVTTPDEEKKVEERVAIGANVVHEAIRREGEDELRRSSSALAWSGLAAGLSMGFSLVAEALLAAYLPKATWTPLISKLGYSVGFLIAVLGRQQLFTENTVTVILPLLLRKNVKTLVQVLRLWSIVLVSNLAGTYLFALCIAHVAIFTPTVQKALVEVSHESAASFWAILVRAVFAGWLIALMVWLLPAADSSRVSMIVLLTYLIGLGNFNHVVAGSNKVFFLIASGVGTWAAYAKGFLAPTLLGNVIGGVSLVAFVNHAQVVAGKGVQPSK